MTVSTSAKMREYIAQTPWNYYEFISDQMRSSSLMIKSIDNVNSIDDIMLWLHHSWQFGLNITKIWLTNKMKQVLAVDLNVGATLPMSVHWKYILDLGFVKRCSLSTTT